MIHPRTEETWCCQHERSQIAADPHGTQCGRETLHVDTMRTAETVVDVRCCWLGWGLTGRVLINGGRAWDGRTVRPRVLVLECAQARIGEIRCRPKQQDHRHRLSEPTVTPRSHLWKYSRPFRKRPAACHLGRSCERLSGRGVSVEGPRDPNSSSIFRRITESDWPCSCHRITSPEMSGPSGHIKP